jgi:hypothetical protein
MKRQDDNPYMSPTAPPPMVELSALGVGGLTCPYCGWRFPLTWRRYIGEPWSFHTCPACQKRGRLRYTSRYVAASIVTMLVLVGGGLVLGHLLDENWGMLVGGAMGVLLGIPLDKKYDQRLRVFEATH